MKILKRPSEMDPAEEIFSNLPPEIVLDILSRNPIKTVFTCKCVCKSWLGLLESPEFARSHLSNSVPGLLTRYCIETNGTNTAVFKIFGFEGSLEIECHELHYKRVLELRSENLFGDSNPRIIQIDGSANGLLFFGDSFRNRNNYYILNPITRERLRLPKPEGIPERGAIVARGFGVSRLSNQYKVVMIFHNFVLNPDTGLLSSIPAEIVCQVYTLGTGSWRSITAPRETSVGSSTGKLFNGNLHWLTVDLMGALWISRFDIETEVFTKFRAPMLECEEESLIEIGVLRDRLCVSEFLSMNEIVIYLMTDDAYEKESWNKECVITISQIPPRRGSIDSVCPVVLDHDCLLCYSNRSKTIALVEMSYEEVGVYTAAILYTPSFISLKDFEIENAKLFEFTCSMS